TGMSQPNEAGPSFEMGFAEARSRKRELLAELAASHDHKPEAPAKGPHKPEAPARESGRSLAEQDPNAKRQAGDEPETPARGSARPRPLAPEDLLVRWPGDPRSDPDVASLLFADYLKRLAQGETPQLAEYEERFPEHTDSLARLFSQHQFLCSLEQ